MRIRGLLVVLVSSAVVLSTPIIAGASRAADVPNARDALTLRASKHSVPEWAKTTYGMPVCETTRDMDCIEGLRVRTGGTWKVARLISSARSDWVDEHLGAGFDIWTRWQYQSASEGPVNVELLGRMQSRGVKRDGKDALDHGMRIMVSRQADDDHRFTSVEDLDCSTGVEDDCILGTPRLPPDDFFQVIVRTSWLRDNQAYVAGLDMAIDRKAITGGNRWTFGARQTLVPRPAKWDEVTPALGWIASLHFGVDHAGDGVHDSAWDPRCADYGAPWKSTNAAGSGRLRWNKGSQSLEFQIFSPHLNPHGKPYIGDFTAFIPMAWLKCYSGKNVRPAYLSVQVVSEDGVEQAATTSVSVRSGVVRVRATGFTFSRPSIRLSTKR